MKMAKGKMMKGKSKSPKALKGAFKQADTMAEGKTMGNPRMAKAREKRLSKASV
jgi:hypothetical protein